MNTLSRATTAHIFGHPQSYIRLQAHWSQLMSSERRHELSASHHLLYLALMGKDWRKAFTPPSNPTKLANGAMHDWKLLPAIATIHSDFLQDDLLAPFEGYVTPEMVQTLRQLLPKFWTRAIDPEMYQNGAFPVDAYRDVELSAVDVNAAKESNNV